MLTGTWAHRGTTYKGPLRPYSCLLGTNMSSPKMHFWRWFSFSQRWDMLVPWRVIVTNVVSMTSGQFIQNTSPPNPSQNSLEGMQLRVNRKPPVGSKQNSPEEAGWHPGKINGWTLKIHPTRNPENHLPTKGPHHFGGTQPFIFQGNFGFPFQFGSLEIATKVIPQLFGPEERESDKSVRVFIKKQSGTLKIYDLYWKDRKYSI